ncbi:MAG: ABC transporter ATP-binding protein [Streptomycetaceae bacterium]|nr:MAG: ABC transporter ATP-binding protein [Streptomycetaceae bacterium]
MKGSTVNLNLHNVSVEDEREVILKDITFDFKPGKIYVLIGRTGSGKTSLMRTIAGLIEPTDGEIYLGEERLDEVPIWQRGIAMVYQQFINYPQRTVLNNVEFPLLRSGISKADAKVQALAMLEKVGLTEFKDRKPSQLSGGQQQRVAIARALVRNTRVILLDEPLMNLDYKLREQLREEFRILFKTTSNSVTIYATTEPSESLFLGDELLVMRQGRIIQHGKPNYVFENPSTIDVAQIVNDPPMSILDGEIKGGRVNIDGSINFEVPNHLKSQPDGKYKIGMRASEVILGGNMSNSEEGSVSLAEVSGSETLLYVKLRIGEVVLQLEGIHDYHIGQRVVISIAPERIFLFNMDSTLCAAPGN